jgi:PqqD family protein of HPr-rel-A system
MWRIIPGQELHYREWDEEFVLFNNLSGDTHLLGISAIYLLQALQGRAAECSELADSLCASLEIERDADVEDDVRNLLHDLQSQYLVETVS